MLSILLDTSLALCEKIAKTYKEKIAPIIFCNSKKVFATSAAVVERSNALVYLMTG